MTEFGINNAEQYAEDHNLVKYETIQCLCTINELGINNCDNCNGLGVIEIPIYPQDYVLDLSRVIDIAGEKILLHELLKALGLKSMYGSEYARKLRPRIEKWVKLGATGCPIGSIHVCGAVYDVKTRLLDICDEAEKREEKVIWG